MNYTVLTFIKLQFLEGWTQDFSIDEMIITYTPSGTAGELLVVTDWPGLGVHTVKFNVTATEGKVLVSTQAPIVQIPANCVSSIEGDITACQHRRIPG
jgi:hypothetical protein